MSRRQSVQGRRGDIALAAIGLSLACHGAAMQRPIGWNIQSFSSVGRMHPPMPAGPASAYRRKPNGSGGKGGSRAAGLPVGFRGAGWNAVQFRSPTGGNSTHDASGAFPTNDFGLYDLVGNVWQWCENWYQPDAYSVDPSMSPVESAGTHRARRGGAWNVIQPFRLRTANRGALDPHATAPNVGFRCVRPIAETATLEDSSAADQVERVLETLRPAMEADGGGVDWSLPKRVLFASAYAEPAWRVPA